MRTRFTRFLVALALAIAIPVQGFAAVSAGICMGLGHHGADMSAAHATQGEHVHADHAHADGAPATAGDHHADAGSENDAHCAPCVACCAAPTISSSPRIFIPETSGVAAVAQSEQSFSGIAPESLDRPPLAL